MTVFKENELFIYKNVDSYELGKVKRPNNTGTGYFCWYHTGSTCANTPVECMHKLTNSYVIKETLFNSLDDRKQSRWYGEYDGYADGNPVYDIWSCGECGHVFEEWDEEPDWNYCPMCGAKMR